MRTHDLFFFASFFFLLGILLASLGWKEGMLIIVFTGTGIALALAFVIKKKRLLIPLALLFLMILPGALYEAADAKTKSRISIPFNEKNMFTGKVTSNPVKKERQEFKLALLPPHKGNVQVQTNLYPEYSFGDILKFGGTIQKTKGGYGSYLENTKDIRGISYFPKLEKREERTARTAWLFDIKKYFLASFRKTLPYTEAAFLGGITVGEREEFTPELKDAMSKSGTTHLVALSGYNITILIQVTVGTLIYLISRKRAFYGTILVV
ncbi:MAG: ComEC/Rec2 family competence protein, partial [Nanoarchaeota archaeon]|nr:ComEC/Rec2 family competence protein [Nanoarchaeota archaeon]